MQIFNKYKEKYGYAIIPLLSTFLLNDLVYWGGMAIAGNRYHFDLLEILFLVLLVNDIEPNLEEGNLSDLLSFLDRKLCSGSRKRKGLFLPLSFCRSDGPSDLFPVFCIFPNHEYPSGACGKFPERSSSWLALFH